MKPAYLRMIKRMSVGGRREWSVYMLRCGDGSLYTGIAKDVHLRLKKHQAGTGAAYTRTHLPVALVYLEPRRSRSKALQREAALKRLSRHKKLALIEKYTSFAETVAHPSGGRDTISV